METLATDIKRQITKRGKSKRKTARTPAEQNCGPTVEWQQHHVYVPPEKNQHTNRTAGQNKTPVAEALEKGDINGHQFLAARRYYIGYAVTVAKADVRFDEELPGTPVDPNYCAREQITTQWLRVRGKMTWKELHAIDRFVVWDQRASKFGSGLTSAKAPAVRKAVGMAYAIDALDKCCFEWGIGPLQRARDRAA